MSRVAKFALLVCIVTLAARVTILDAAFDGLALLAWAAGLVALASWLRGGAK